MRAMRILVLPFCLLCSAQGARAEDDVPVEVHPITVQGRLERTKHKRDGGVVVRFAVQVGPRRYVLDGNADVLKRLRKLNRKFVRFETLPAASPGRPGKLTVPVELARPAAVTAQVLRPFEGLVSKTEVVGKRSFFVLRGDTGTLRVARRDERKFAAFAGQNVEARAYATADDHFGRLEQVKAVVRKLLPGERDPKDGVEALAARWAGTLTATQVPKGVPGAQVGDYPISFEAADKAGHATGRVFDTYDVLGATVHGFKRKTRAIEIDLAYSLGRGGSYALRLQGVFHSDWKTIEGTWTSGFLGSGTFVLRLASK